MNYLFLSRFITIERRIKMFFEEEELKKKLEDDFNLYKMKLTNEEAKAFVDGKLNVNCFYEAFELNNPRQIWGGVYMYKDNKPFRACSAYFNTYAELDEDYFENNYAWKPIWLGHEFSKEAKVFSKDEDVAYLEFNVNEIYNAFEWQNHLALLRLEEDWLQPDDYLQA